MDPGKSVRKKGTVKADGAPREHNEHFSSPSAFSLAETVSSVLSRTLDVNLHDELLILRKGVKLDIRIRTNQSFYHVRQLQDGYFFIVSDINHFS